MHRGTHSRLFALVVGLLAVVAGLLHIPSAQASRADCVPEATWPGADVGWADRVVALVNAHRASLGLSQLQISSSLTNSAVWKARQLANDVNVGSAGANFTHDDPAAPELPTGRTAATRIGACGYGSQFGENIATGQDTPEEAMAAWLASPEHKANLEYPNFSVIGVGAAVGGPAGNAWVQDFGMAPDALQATSAPTAVPGLASTAPSAVSPGSVTAGSAGSAAATASAATVEILARPRVRTRSRSARIKWRTTGPVAGVACSLDGRKVSCTTTRHTLRAVGTGRHEFRVTVTGANGSRSSARVRWRVMRPGAS